jgi:hypothetical protein
MSWSVMRQFHAQLIQATPILDCLQIQRFLIFTVVSYIR